MTSIRIDTDYVHQQYKTLCQEAMSADPWGQRGHGLSLFLTRGMNAWVETLTVLMPQSKKTSQSDNPVTPWQTPELPVSVRSDLTTVLAEMVLACTQETR